MGYSQMVKDEMLGEINTQQKKALEKVVVRSKELLRMISEILQVTVIEAGKMKVEAEEIRLAELLDELRSTYEIPLDKELVFKWDYSSEPRAVRTDGDKLKHILQNLINNAIKFTDEGHIAISARYLGDTKVLEFKVADTGTGIRQDLLPSIFEMFRQLDSSATRTHGGAGLGLYIVKKYTDALQGNIDVQSEVGRGSVFTITIPC
jgi:signal transduction histidine kinase